MVTEFGTNDPQTVKLWSKMLAREVIYRTYFRKFMGRNEDSIIQRIMDVEENRGDNVRVDLIVQMQQYGVVGDNPMEGFEESLTFHQDSVSIDQRRIGHAFRTMSQQRTNHDLRMVARRNLADRYAAILDEFMFAYLAGSAGANAALAAVLPHAGNALAAPDANHLVDKNAETFRTDHIEICLEKAVTISPIVRAPSVDGEQIFTFLVHPFQLTDLRINASTTTWKDMVAQAAARGATNPLFTNAAIKWGGAVVHCSPRVIRDSSNKALSLMLGCQAGVVAFGNAYGKLDQQTMGGDNFFSWFERKKDYGNERGVAAGAIFGIKKLRFNSADFGLIQLKTVGAAH